MSISINQKIARMHLLSATLIILFFTAFLVLLFRFTHERHIEVQVSFIKDAVIEGKKDFIKNNVYRTIAEIDRERSSCQEFLEEGDRRQRQTGILDVDVYCSESAIKERMIQQIRDTFLIDNGYLWINEVLNYDGGNGYARRLVHPNLPETEGLLLSTDLTDIKGNTPYLEELEGVKKQGELFFTYWFKEKDSAIISEKISFAKLYKDYNWIIASGVYLDDVETMVHESEHALRPVFSRTIVAIILLGIVVAVCAFVIASLFHRRINTIIAGYIEKNADKEKEIVDMNANLEKRVRERTKAIEESEQRLRESEEKYHDLYNNAPDMFVSVDVGTGLVIECNNTLCKKTGFQREEIIGAVIEDLYHADSKEQAAAIFETFVKEGKVSDKHLFLRKKDGGKLAVSLNATSVRDESGHILYSRSAWRDITELVKMEQELRQAQKMEAIGTLAGGIAHDFNNILASILGNAELAIEDVEPGSEIEENLREIQTAGDRAATLVKQILTFARQSDEELSPLKVSNIAGELAQFIRSSIPATIEIEFSIDSTSSVMANPAQIQQILMNLCTNSAHAMEREGGRLTISVTDVTKNGKEFVLISVSDTGEGIDPKIKATIFEPYFTTKPVGKGTGIGLAVVHGIVNDYGGMVEVESTIGSGTTIDIYLPAKDGISKEDATDLIEVVGGSENILLVDDEVSIARALTKRLQRLGYHVTSCSESRKALELFKENPGDYDALITDMTMPGLTGDKLVAACRSVKPELVTIICTGYSELFTPGEELAPGIDALVHKPVVFGEFIKTVRTALDTSKGGMIST